MKIIINILLICFFTFYIPLYAIEETHIIGKVEDIEGEHVYIRFDKGNEAESGTIFGVYGFDQKPIAICEITRLKYEGTVLASVLLQMEEIKKGYTVLSDLKLEHKLREKIKRLREKGEYFDFYKKFTSSYHYKDINYDVKEAEDVLLGKALMDILSFLKMDICLFRQIDRENVEDAFMTPRELGCLDAYRDIISRDIVLKVDQVNKTIFLETNVNLGELKSKLRQQGYSLKAKIIRLVFPYDRYNEYIRDAREIILENSIYISREEEGSQDITNPISCIIYTTPKVFAQEIKGFVHRELSIVPLAVYGDTIELDVFEP